MPTFDSSSRMGRKAGTTRSSITMPPVFLSVCTAPPTHFHLTGTVIHKLGKRETRQRGQNKRLTMRARLRDVVSRFLSPPFIER